MSSEVSLGRIVAVTGTTARLRLHDHLSAIGEAASVRPAAAAGCSVGALVKVMVENSILLASVNEVVPAAGEAMALEAEVSFIGEGAVGQDGALSDFRRGVSRYPFAGDEVFPTSRADLAQIFKLDSRWAISLGIIHPTQDLKAAIDLELLLSRHFAVLGSTGVGKSTCVAQLLHKILDAAPAGHVVLIDPHGEYASAFRDRSIVLDVNSLKLPYWLMNFEEHAEAFLTGDMASRDRDRDILGKCLLHVRQKNYLNLKVDRITADSPIPYFASDLLEELELEAGRLEKSADPSRYVKLKLKIEEMYRDPRYGFMFNESFISDTMSEILSTILRIPNHHKPLTILDVSGVPSEIVNVLVSMISRLTFDYSIWSRGESKVPVLLVCEEAQRYLPRESGNLKSAAQRNFERIAKEGRKHGISLGLITQRPSDLSEAVLSQCGSLFVMRLTTERDQNFIKSAVPDWAHGVVSSISALRNRECIAFGECVPMPVRVAIDFLEEERRPSSSEPRFTEAWNAPPTDPGMVPRIISRWRNQRHDQG